MDYPYPECLSPSVYEKGKDLVIQELATRPLTQDLLQEEVRKAPSPLIHPYHTTPAVWTTY